MKKKILIINPKEFYNYILLYTDIFLDMQITLIEIEIGNISTKKIINEINSYDFVFYDDFNNVNSYHYFKKQILNHHGDKVKIYSLLKKYEQHFKKASIIEINKIILIPEYLKDLNEKIFLNILLRIADILFVLVLSPLVVITLILSILLLKIFTNGPILFKQTRVGKNSEPFTIYKLRTMYISSNDDYTQSNDSRIFPLGKILRKLKIDELPQLFNIIKGDMSFIGPRPERLDIFNKICETNPFFSKRVIVKPGLTGWAQVHNPIATPNESFEKLQYDVYFIKHSSIKMFFKIFFKTIIIVLKKKSM